MWISVGQEPDVRGLLAELLRQSNGRVLEAESTESEALAMVKAALVGVKALLILDGVCVGGVDGSRSSLALR